MNKFKCSCGNIIETEKQSGVKCRCGKVASKKLTICPICNKKKFITYNAKRCNECANQVRTESMKNSEKRFKSPDKSFDVPKELLKGKPTRIQQLIKYNWWSNNDFALKVSKCETVEEAEEMLDELNRFYVKAHYHGGSGYAVHR